MFAEGFQVADIAEPLVSFDAETPARTVAAAHGPCRVRRSPASAGTAAWSDSSSGPASATGRAGPASKQVPPRAVLAGLRAAVGSGPDPGRASRGCS